MANITSSRRKQRRHASSSKRSGIAPWRRLTYKGTMRLAFEAAIRRANPDILVRHQALLGQVKGDGLLTTTTWSGPRDGNSARA